MTTLDNKFMILAVAGALAGTLGGCDGSSPEAGEDPTVISYPGGPRAPGERIDGTPDPEVFGDGWTLGEPTPAGSLDSDGDGTPDERDLCPGGGAADSMTGCSLEMPADLPGSLDDPPTTGQVSDSGFVAIVLGADADHPFIFWVHQSNMVETDEGWAVRGALLLETPVGQIVLANTLVTFMADPATREPVGVRGQGELPFPALGVMAGAEVGAPLQIELGWGPGDAPHLAALEAPLRGDRDYLYFNYEVGLEAGFGPFALGPEGKQGVIVLDPHDPFLYLRGDFLSMPELGGDDDRKGDDDRVHNDSNDPNRNDRSDEEEEQGEEGPEVGDLGIGVSIQGLIPFEPVHRFGFEGQDLSFDGHVFVEGKVELATLPIAIEGTTVLDLDPQADGVLEPFAPLQDRRIGANAAVSVSYSFEVPGVSQEAVDEVVPSIDMHLGGASLVGELGEQRTEGSLSGAVEPDFAALPLALPFEISAQALFAAHLSATDPLSSFAHLQSELAVDLGKLAPVGVDLGQLSANSNVYIDSRGYTLDGHIEGGFALHPDITVGGGATIHASFGRDPAAWEASIAGNVEVAGVQLAAATVEVSPSRVHISGMLDTGAAEVRMSGTITPGGFDLEGYTSVNIDVVASDEVHDAVCAPTALECEVALSCEVANSCDVANSCSVESCSFIDFFTTSCGWETITSAAECGTTTVVDAVVCGTTTVADAAICGTEVVIDAGKCGVKYSSHALCTATEPLSVGAEVTLGIGTSGLYGSVAGNACGGGECVSIDSGRLEVNFPIEVCVSVPEIPGEHCATL
ncbi:MAG: hypothetical protein OXT09_16210 [Myxococcales bacterium]|nr:hypothetical protein [Myxococcales bacterium]